MGVLDTNITVELVTKEQIQLLNTIMSSSFKWEMNMSVCAQRTCCEEHYCDGVSDGSVPFPE
jgi:hypothetical protein